MTDFTANIISGELVQNISQINNVIKNIFVCGGGRKNKNLIDKIQKNLGSSLKLKNIDDFKINGDFIESQAFAYLAIRSLLRLPISFPNTTGCKTPSTGGEIIDF